MFRDCILVVKKCHICHINNRRACAPLAPLHLVVIIGPFSKWGIDLMTCNPHLAWGHGYIIIEGYYFTKWVEVMPTNENNGKTTTFFLFNHVIVRFGVPQAISMDHGKNFRNYMMSKLTTKLGL